MNTSVDIESIISGNATYKNWYERWMYYLRSYIGGQDYQTAGYLTKYVNETQNEYNARCIQTPLENHCASVISVYNSFLFRENPERELGQIKTLPEVEEILEDCDFENRSMDQFMHDLHSWVGVFGHAWVVVTQANVDAETRADQQSQGVRPYLNMLTPLAVLDWKYTRSASGRYTLDYFKYIEDSNGDIQIIKEWTPDFVRTSTVNVNRKELTADSVLVDNELGYIPAVIAYNKRSITRGLGVSDITDIADLQKFIYNSTSEVEQSIRLNTHPSLVKTPDTQAGIGAGSIIQVPENLDPGLKPYLLEFNGASVSSIYQAIDHAISAIDKIANTGAVRATESKVMSGVAMETEFQLLNAKLSSKANNMELAEENIWRIVCDYLDREWNGVITYPGSFNIRDTSGEIAQLKVAKEAASTNTVLEYIDKEIVKWLDIEEEVNITIPNADE